MLTPEPPPALPSHVEDALKAIVTMEAAHHDKASPLAHFVDRVTATVARPGFLLLTAAAVLLWIAINLALGYAGLPVPDEPPFLWLALLAACAALFIAILILVSQTRADRLANLRAQMTLEMSLLTTQKASKLVELMEEFRRDSPNVKDRIDLQALEMADVPDHGTVLQAIQDITDNPPGPAA